MVTPYESHGPRLVVSFYVEGKCDGSESFLLSMVLIFIMQ